MADENKPDTNDQDSKPDPDNGSSQQASGQGSSDAAQLRERLRVMEAEAASLRSKNEERKKKEAQKKKDKEEQEALARGEHENLIKQLKEQLNQQSEIVENFKKQAQERLDKKIEALPDEAKAELELIRDSVPHDKLEGLVDMKLGKGAQSMELEPGTPAPPAPSAASGTGQRKEDALDADTVKILDKLMADESVYEIGRQIGHFGINSAGDQKFRFMATGDDDEDTRRFIRLVKATSVDDPFAKRKAEQLKRVKELKEKI